MFTTGASCSVAILGKKIENWNNEIKSMRIKYAKKYERNNQLRDESRKKLLSAYYKDKQKKEIRKHRNYVKKRISDSRKGEGNGK